MRNNVFYKSSMVIVYGKLILVQLFWSGVFICGQLALNYQDPMTITIIRAFLTAIILIVLLLTMSSSIHLYRLKLSTFVCLLWMSFFGVFIYNYFIYLGLQRTSVVSATLLVPMTQPIFTTILSTLINHERLSREHYFGLGLGVVGATAILSGEWALKPTMNDLIGDALIILATIAFSIYTVSSHFIKDQLTSLEITTYTNILGTLIMLPIFLWHLPVNFSVPMSFEFYAYMLYLVLLGTVIPYIWWYDGVKRIGPSKTGAITLFMPPMALLLAAIFLKQTPSLLQLVGGCIGLTGMTFITGMIHLRRRR